MKHKIGIVGWGVGENSFGASRSYMEFLSRFGDVLILPPTYTILKDLDLVVLPGGSDTLSHNYSEAPSFFNTNPDLMKEFFFLNNLKPYVEQGTPVFGICLGFQMLNVFFGGKLTQNTWHPTSEKSRSELVHELKFAPEFRDLQKELCKDYKKDQKFEVNSLHHQGVTFEDLGAGLNVVASHDEIVEAFTHETLAVSGVQYHPEDIYDSLSIHLIEKLLSNGRTESLHTTDKRNTEVLS